MGVHDFPIVKIGLMGDTIRRLYLALSLCVISHVIVSVVISLMYSQVMQRQVKRMVTLHLFIESH